MAGEQVSERQEINGEDGLSKEALTQRLIKLANASATAASLEDRDQLDSWMSQYRVFETFKAVINSYGRPGKLDYSFDRPGCLSDAIFDELEIGEDGEESRLFQARLIKSPASIGPAIHIYARDDGIPAYGVFLPFTERGTLDPSRSISGGYFAADGAHSFNPPREPVVDKEGKELIFNQKVTHTDKETASVIAHATCMSAAQLVFYFEKAEHSLAEL